MSTDQPSGVCDHCGLPLGRAWFGRKAADAAGPQYCCFGCRFAADVMRERGAGGQICNTLAKLGLSVFLALNVMVFTMVLWTSDVYKIGPESTTLIGPMENLFRYLCLLFSLPVLWLLGQPLLENAWETIRAGRPSTDALLILGVASAYVYSAVSVFHSAGHIYFEVGCLILVLVTFGRWLEANGKVQAIAALDALQKWLPAEVCVERQGLEQRVPLEAVIVGDLIYVRAGERIPTDGIIAEGRASIDEQIVTGESQPAVKEPGDSVFGGTINVDGDLLIGVTADARHGTLQRLIDAVQQARLAKGHYQCLADRVSAWFLPAMIFVALATFAWHVCHGNLEQAGLATLAVVLIACPCALGLATPLAIWVALGSAARAQVLFRSSDSLERLAKVRSICFDKTGTLTTGSAQVTDFVTEEGEAEEVLARAYAVASASNHTLSKAITQLAEMRSGSALPQTTSSAKFSSAPLYVRTLAGRGLEATLADLSTLVLLGSVRMMDEGRMFWTQTLQARRDEWLAAGDSVACIGWGSVVRGIFRFEEQFRRSTIAALDACRERGLQLKVMTGDHAIRGARLGLQLGVPVLAELLPEGKVAAIRAMQRENGMVAMVGDGINDAPALATADVGIALGCGADLSRESAHVCLLGNDLARIPWAIDLASRTVRVIRQNLFWSFAYNVVGIGLAATGWLNPIWAALAMVLSSSLVIGNSLRLGHELPLDNKGETTHDPVEKESHDRGEPDSTREQELVIAAPAGEESH